MGISLEVIFRSEKNRHVCFKHAIKDALDNVKIQCTAESDYRSDYNLARTWCQLCSEDRQ